MEKHKQEEHGYLCSICQTKLCEWSDIKNHTLIEHGGYLSSEFSSGNFHIHILCGERARKVLEFLHWRKWWTLHLIMSGIYKLIVSITNHWSLKDHPCKLVNLLLVRCHSQDCPLNELMVKTDIENYIEIYIIPLDYINIFQF